MRFVFRNNIVPENRYGVIGGDTGSGDAGEIACGYRLAAAPMMTLPEKPIGK